MLKANLDVGMQVRFRRKPATLMWDKKAGRGPGVADGWVSRVIPHEFFGVPTAIIRLHWDAWVGSDSCYVAVDDSQGVYVRADLLQPMPELPRLDAEGGELDGDLE